MSACLPWYTEKKKKATNQLAWDARQFSVQESFSYVSFWKLKMGIYSTWTESLRASLQVLAIHTSTPLCCGSFRNAPLPQDPATRPRAFAGIKQPKSKEVFSSAASFYSAACNACLPFWYRILQLPGAILVYTGHSEQKANISCYFCSWLPEQAAPVHHRSTFLMKQLWDQCCMTSKSKTVYN